MKRFTGLLIVFVVVLFFTVPVFSGKGQGGPGSKGEGVSGGGTGGGEEEVPPDISGPINDKMSDTGKLFGDLYVILRYAGGETKNTPKYDEDGKPVLKQVSWSTPDGNTGTVWQQEWDTATAVGGEPVLSEDFAVYQVINEDTGVPEINPSTGDSWYLAPTPSQCVQPVASYQGWGDISTVTGLSDNRIPLAKTYDATWGRTECEVGVASFSVDGAMVIDPWFIEADNQWTDPFNGQVTYTFGVKWEDIVQEVHFGRLNIGRAPEAVLQASFDEAISAINAAVAIEIDSSGRLLLTKELYSTFEVDLATGEPILIGTYKKAIDSPLENLAFYVKLLSDGHLVTPGDEREPLDRSENGGVPLWKMIELEDGPSQALRPTIDIAKMKDWGLGELVDVSEKAYYSYYKIVYDGECNPISRELVTSTILSCEVIADVDECGTEILCSGPDTGILSDIVKTPSLQAFEFAASFFASAADKTGYITADMVVYLNSILGLNKVIGYSETDADGLPTPDAIDYSRNPDYYDFSAIVGYDRNWRYAHRGEVETQGGSGSAPTYTGTARVLQPTAPGEEFTDYYQHYTNLLGNDDAAVHVEFGPIEIGWSSDSASPGPIDILGVDDILGFTQMAEDDLSVIYFIHTYQIPGRR